MIELMRVNYVSDLNNCCRHAIYVWERSRGCFRYVIHCLFPCLIIWIIQSFTNGMSLL